jgi:hypothetical protein
MPLAIALALMPVSFSSAGNEISSKTLEAISKKGFWFKIAAAARFHAKPDSPSDLILFVGHKPEVHLRRIVRI